IMWLSLLSGLIGGAAFLFALYRWVIPTAMQYHGGLALLWHDTRTSRPQRLLKAVQRKAAVVDPQSVITAIDHKHREWAMNVGDENGAVWIKCSLNGYCLGVRHLLWVLNSVNSSPGVSVITLEFNPDYSAIARQVIRWSGLEEKMRSHYCCPGAASGGSSSGAWISRLKEHFGVQAFDLVFLDHWKDRYLPDTKPLEGIIDSIVMLADNVICPGTPDYLEYVRNSSRYNSHYYRSHLEYTKAENGLEKSAFLGY
uniref:Catechol-O-methyltransferase b n=1 Tax=Salmo trutta TaxID=8032 RepID=A0A673YYE9_SALTR